MKITKLVFASCTLLLLGAIAAVPTLASENTDDARQRVMNKPARLTELVFILDKSGSMSGLEKDTIGGFNSLINQQKEQEGKAIVTTVLFNHKSATLYNRTPLSRVPAMTNAQYRVGGSTALLDAVGNTMNSVYSLQQDMDPEERPDKTLFVIITDGMENASREYTYDKVKGMVSRRKEADKWEFLFLGANIDAAKEAGRFGIAPNRAVRYKNDSKGVGKNFHAVGAAVSAVRAQQEIKDSWADEIKADYNTRK